MTTEIDVRSHPPAGKATSETTRKLIHIAMGFFALLLAFLTWWQALLFGLVALLHNLFVLPLYLRKTIYRGEARRSGFDVGIILYPASIAVLVLVFRTRLEIAAAGWALLAFGDGLATVAGTTLGGPRLPWNRRKSWTGFLAFVFFGFLATRFLYVWTFAGHHPAELRDGWEQWIVGIILATTLLAAILESLPIGVDDNVLVTLVPAGFLYALTLFDPIAWDAHRQAVLGNLPWAIGVNGILAGAAYAARSVSVSGVVGGILAGGMLFAFGGWRVFTMLFLFFVLGTAATKVGHATKAALGIAQEKGGRRGAKNAVANCGMGAVLAWIAATTPYESLALLGLASAFATAAADTVSSEIGQAYGRRTFLITTFRPVPRGTDGAVSLEGTLAGLGAAMVLAIAALVLGLVSVSGSVIVVAAALFGSTLESYMGALWERAKLIDNEAINFANTLAGALFGMGIARVCGVA